MKILTPRNSIRLLLLIALLCAVGPRLSSLAAPAASLTVVNTSSREILHLYLSPADSDQWGADQLNESAIAPGATRTLTVTWDQATVKVVVEDRDGCFLTTTADASSSIEWTITNSTAANCGN